MGFYTKNGGLVGTGFIAEPEGVYDTIFSQLYTGMPKGQDITTNWYEISNRFINSQTYMGNSSDYNGPWDVGEVQSNFSGSGRIYIGVKITASTTYYNDVCIAGVQVVNSANNTLEEDYIFSGSTGGSGSSWTTARTQRTGSSSQGFPDSPSYWDSTPTYYGMSTQSGTDRFSWATSTASSYTGCAGGISSNYNTILAPVGDAQIGQTGANYYAYREASGSTRWSGSVMRSPSRTFTAGSWIRVIHALTGPSSQASNIDPLDSLYIAVY